jgi:hypothetical protein
LEAAEVGSERRLVDCRLHVPTDNLPSHWHLIVSMSTSRNVFFTKDAICANNGVSHRAAIAARVGMEQESQTPRSMS